MRIIRIKLYFKRCLFCTMGGSGNKRAFLKIEELIEKKSLATLTLTTEEVVSGNISEKLMASSHLTDDLEAANYAEIKPDTV